MLKRESKKALSFKQPVAWLIVNGYLSIDDRTWYTQYRGVIAIHASKGFYPEYYNYLKLHTDIPLPAAEDFDYGGIVGVATLKDCLVSVTYAVGLHGLTRVHNGPSGIFGFEFENPKACPFIPMSGNTGIFDIPETGWPIKTFSTKKW